MHLIGYIERMVTMCDGVAHLTGPGIVVAASGQRNPVWVIHPFFCNSRRGSNLCFSQSFSIFGVGE